MCHACSRCLALEGARRPIIPHTCQHRYTHQSFIGLNHFIDCLLYICLFLSLIPMSALISLCFPCPDTVSVLCYLLNIHSQYLLPVSQHLSSPNAGTTIGSIREFYFIFWLMKSGPGAAAEATRDASAGSGFHASAGSRGFLASVGSAGSHAMPQPACRAPTPQPGRLVPTPFLSVICL